MSNRALRILIIDGQGGRLGKQLVEAVKAAMPGAQVTAVGTNSIATACMLKAGADQAATGENAVKVACRKADVVVGPIGMVIADALLGEITPAMAAAVGQCEAQKLLIPAGKCNNQVVGAPEYPLAKWVELTVARLLQMEAAE